MPPRKGRKGKKAEGFIDVKKSGPEQWDSILYVHPKKLTEPCARIESDGEWFPIDRVLDSIYIVGTDKMWQHLVQWKPCWSKRVTPSALRDFHCHATVLGCVVKEDVLRSRARQKIEWTRSEFMCSNFMVRLVDPDGTSTIEVMPYPDVKRRFPDALFEYMEKKMESPRVRDEDRPRTDGLLSVYDDINIPVCVNLDPDALKTCKKDSPEASMKGDSEDSTGASSTCKSASNEKRKRKKSRHYKGYKTKTVRKKSRVLEEIEHSGAAGSSQDAAAKVSNPDHHTPLTNILNTSAKFKQNESMKADNETHKKKSPSKAEKSPNAPIPTMRAASPMKRDRKSATPSLLHSRKKRTSLSNDDVMIIEDHSRTRSAKNSPPTRTSARNSPKFLPNGKRNSKGNDVVSPGDCPKTPNRAKRVISPRLSLGVNSAKRTTPDLKQRGCKRSAPLRSRNSLDNYFSPEDFKHRRLSGDENGPKSNVK